MNSEDAFTFPTFTPMSSLACKCESSRFAPSCAHVLLFILVYKILGELDEASFTNEWLRSEIGDTREQDKQYIAICEASPQCDVWLVTGQHCDVPEKPGKGTLFSFFIITVMNNFGQFSTYLVNSRRGVSFWSLTGNPVTNGIDGKFPY